jgi:hypothetical protein
MTPYCKDIVCFVVLLLSSTMNFTLPRESEDKLNNLKPMQTRQAAVRLPSFPDRNIP